MPRFVVSTLVGLTVCLLLAAVQPALAQLPPVKDPVTIELKGHKVEDQKLVFEYSISYDGMVELSILNAKNKKLWRGQFANKKGENFISVKRKAAKDAPGVGPYLPPGNYAYVLYFKGKKANGVFNLN